MVLYKRKPVQSLPTPEIGDDATDVLLIRETGEMFVDKQSFDERMEFYNTKQFSCEITGHMNLSFFDAMSSEQMHSQDVEQAFPEPLKEPVLRKVQFSQISRIDTLVDTLHDAFKNDFYPGEHITAILTSGDRVEAVVREKTMFPELRFANGDVQRKGFSRYTVRLVNRNDEEHQIDNEHLIRDKKTFTKAMLRSFIKNSVYREPWNGAPWLVKEEYATKFKIPQDVPPHLQKSSAAERKAAQARRKTDSQPPPVAVANGASASPPAPVDIRPAPTKSHKSKSQQAAMKMSKLLQIDTDPRPDGTSMAGSPFNSSPGGTPDANMGRSSAKSFAKHSPPPPPPKPIKYPIEDLDVPSQEQARRPKLKFLSALDALRLDVPVNGRELSPTLKTERLSLASPIPSDNLVDEDKVSFILSTWVFLNIYCESLILDSFTFEDYLQALYFNTEETHCELLVEIHCALLKQIVNEQGSLQAQLPELDEDSDSEEGDQEMPDAPENVIEANGDEGDHPTERETSSEKSAGKQKKHSADELFADGHTWIQHLKARSFKDGGWQAIVVGILRQLAADDRLARDAEDVLRQLTPPDEKPTFETVSAQYLALNINSRAMILHLLQGIVHETSAVRGYIEECAEEMTKHRKEKIEIQRARKVLLEELKGLDDERKILLPENTPKSPSPEPPSRHSSLDADGDSKMNGVGVGDEEDDEDEGDEGVSARALRRGGERANERKRKRDAEKVKADVVAKLPKTAKQFQKVLKSIETTKKKIEEEEKKIANIDEDLRQADCSRFKMMGKDRFWNKYWWFERNGMPFGGLPNASTAYAGYANALIWIQGPDPTEREGFLVHEYGTNVPRDALGNIVMNGHNRLSVLERQAREENGTILETPTRYGYIETPEEFEQLLSWLDIRGAREKKLKVTLEDYKKQIVLGMENREKYLSGATTAAIEKEASSGRMSTRGKQQTPDPSIWRCLNWKNATAIEDLGHTHYEQPLPRKNAKKGAGAYPKGTPLNRQGKPMGRQGERYNF